MKFKFNNGTEIEYIRILHDSEFIDGARRSTMEILCPINAMSVDSLNTILSDGNNTQRVVTGDGTQVAVFDDFVIKIKCGVERKQVKAETPDAPAKYTDMLVFKLGRLTYQEKQNMVSMKELEAIKAKLGL